MIKLSFDEKFDSLASGEVLHFDQNLVELIRLILECHRRHHLDVQVLALDQTQNVVDQLVEDGF
jgi:hypothetical protein